MSNVLEWQKQQDKPFGEIETINNIKSIIKKEMQSSPINSKMNFSTKVKEKSISDQNKDMDYQTSCTKNNNHLLMIAPIGTSIPKDLNYKIKTEIIDDVFRAEYKQLSDVKDYSLDRCGQLPLPLSTHKKENSPLSLLPNGSVRFDPTIIYKNNNFLSVQIDNNGHMKSTRSSGSTIMPCDSRKFVNILNYQTVENNNVISDCSSSMIPLNGTSNLKDVQSKMIKNQKRKSSQGSKTSSEKKRSL